MTGVKCGSSICLAGYRVVFCLIEIIAFRLPDTLSLKKNIANSLHIDVEFSSKDSKNGALILFTVANKTRELLLQFVITSDE